MISSPERSLSSRARSNPAREPSESHRESSDQQTVTLVHHALHSTGYPQLTQLQVYFEHGRVTLQGRLATYFLKQVAQTAAISVAAVREIDNDIRVSNCRYL